MIRTIQEFFHSRVNPSTGEVSLDGATQERRIQLATAALLIEVSRADNEVQNDELSAIEDSIASSFGLTKAETQEIVSLARKQVEESISMYEFTRLVDRGFSPEQKKHIVGLLWDVAFSDKRLEENEEYLIRKAAKLLHVAHADFIEEKLRARERKDRGANRER